MRASNREGTFGSAMRRLERNAAFGARRGAPRRYKDLPHHLKRDAVPKCDAVFGARRGF